MSGKGRIKYVPYPIIKQLGDIKKNEGLERDVEGWRRMERLINVGKNVDDFYTQLFGIKIKKKGRL